MNTVLALDASGKTGSVCLLRDGQVAFEAVLPPGLTHSQTLLPLVQNAMQAAGLAPGEVGRYAVTAGPGSFTGLRIGMALVKGLALPFGTPAVGVSTLRALAAASGLRGTVVGALDARRGEVYWAAFTCGNALHRISEDAAGPVEALAPLVDRARAPVFFVGDGAELCYNIFNCDPKVKRAPAAGPPNIARGAAFLALGRDAGSAAALRPRYLRLSQAERERAQRLKARRGGEGQR